MFRFLLLAVLYFSASIEGSAGVTRNLRSRGFSDLSNVDSVYSEDSSPGQARKRVCFAPSYPRTISENGPKFIKDYDTEIGKCYESGSPELGYLMGLIRYGKLHESINLLRHWDFSDNKSGDCIVLSSIDSASTDILSYAFSYNARLSTEMLPVVFEYLVGIQGWHALIHVAFAHREYAIEWFNKFSETDNSLGFKTIFEATYPQSHSELVKALSLAIKNSSHGVLKVFQEIYIAKELTFADLVFEVLGPVKSVTDFSSLLHSGLDYSNFESKSIASLITEAVNNNHFSTVKHLIRLFPKYITQADLWSEAIKRGHFKIVDAFESLGANVTGCKTIVQLVIENNIPMAKYLAYRLNLSKESILELSYSFIDLGDITSIAAIVQAGLLKSNKTKTAVHRYAMQKKQHLIAKYIQEKI